MENDNIIRSAWDNMNDLINDIVANDIIVVAIAWYEC